MDKKFLENCHKFCKAFYYGMEVKLHMKADLTALKVASRINEYTSKIQYKASDILTAVKKFVPSDAYAMICILQDDLYPRDSWNYVFGLADLTGRTGVFSFARYNPTFFGEEAPADLEDMVLHSACKVVEFYKET